LTLVREMCDLLVNADSGEIDVVEFDTIRYVIQIREGVHKRGGDRSQSYQDKIRLKRLLYLRSRV